MRKRGGPHERRGARLCIGLDRASKSIYDLIGKRAAALRAQAADNERRAQPPVVV